jgi:hypothetical protein
MTEHAEATGPGTPIVSDPLGLGLAATLREVAPAYAAVALETIDREYPNSVGLVVTGPGQYREPRDRHPAFYGSFDWHSGVEMHWVLVRLLRLLPGLPSAPAIRAALDAHLTPEALEGEVAWCRANSGFERPYGWAWLLTLAHDLETWDDPDARRWAAAVAPLAELFAGRLVTWLPTLPYPVRHGVHPNTAFALGRSLPFAAHRATTGGPAGDLLGALREATTRLFHGDHGASVAFEPSGHDFLSPALVEADLVARVPPPAGFAAWLDGFLPALAGDGAAPLFRPVTTIDAGDGLQSHLHGLNLSRAWAARVIAAALPGTDGRRAALAGLARDHAAAALPHVTSDDYMVAHWLAVFAVLYLTDEPGSAVAAS